MFFRETSPIKHGKSDLITNFKVGMKNEEIQILGGTSTFWIGMWYQRRINNKRDRCTIPETRYKVVRKRNEKRDGGAKNPVIE